MHLGGFEVLLVLFGLAVPAIVLGGIVYVAVRLAIRHELPSREGSPRGTDQLDHSE